MFAKKLRWMRGAVLLLMITLNTASSAHAQEAGGSGIIIETNPRTASSTLLTPLMCRDELCTRLSALMFPTLYAVDPVNKIPVMATADNNALVTATADVGEGVQRLTLRDDLTWSDGTPITAYDVFYSYLAITSGALNTPYSAVSQQIQSVRPDGDFEIVFIYPQVDCSLPFTSNFPVIPAHLYDPGFAAFVDEHTGSESVTEWFADFRELYPRRMFAVMIDETQDNVPMVSSGVFDAVEVRPQRDIRLLAGNGQLAYVVADDNSPLDRVQLFLNGETNILINPPLEDRDDLIATPDTQVSQYPGLSALTINLNLANPQEPYPAYDLAGEPLDQGHHPIFGDVRVRRAMQMGLNVQQLIDVAYLGYGTPLASNQLPASWAFDATLEPVPYDPAAAGLLLTEAGWRDVNQDGVRDCTHCLYGFENQSLSFDLLYPQEMALMAQFIADQLWMIGVSVRPISSSPDEIIRTAGFQSYDAYLFTHTESFPVNADQTMRFTEAGDFYGTTTNTGSYHNPRVAELFEQARTLPGCDFSEQAALYHEIQTILQEDQPYLWLFAPDDMVVASGGVLVFDPLPNAPFWNIQTWRVVR